MKVETMNYDITSRVDMLDLKKGNTQGGKKEPLKNEDSGKNGDDFKTIVDRMLPDPHGGNT